MAKEKSDYLELIPFVEEKGIKVKCLYTANTLIPYDYKKSEYHKKERLQVYESSVFFRSSGDRMKRVAEMIKKNGPTINCEKI